MAKAKMNSKKGGASSHLRPCKTAYCDKHNERKDKNPSNSNIRPEFSMNNSVWKADDVPNLVTLDRQIRKDYYEAHGRHMPDRGPSKASPLKESVTLMPDGSKKTDEIQRMIVERIEKEFGIRCVRMYNHRDEYCEETGEYNWHGHEVWDMYDHKKHRMVTLSRADCRKWQDIVAEETGMPRGNPAYETRRKWLSANEYKIKKQNESIDEKKAEIETLQNQIREKEEELAKAAKSPIARVIAGVKTKMAGNYTQDDVNEMMTKASAEADERVRTVQEQADKAMAAAAEEADAKVLAVQNELASVRRALADERKKKDEDIRIATEKATRKAWASVNAAINEAVDRSTVDLRGQLEKTRADLLAANGQIDKIKNGSYNASLIAHTFLSILKDDKVTGYKKNDVLALFTDHLDENGRKVVSRILVGNGIDRRLRTTAELERSRQLAASQPKPQKGFGMKR
jgi:hypothetical protein